MLILLAVARTVGATEVKTGRMTTASDVRDNLEASRYEIEAEGRLAILEYVRSGGLIVLKHAETPPPLRGRGLASVLTRHALEAARADGLRVVPRCPFVRDYIDRHPEYQSLIDADA